MSDLSTTISAVKARFDDNCFACGMDNPFGLGIQIDAQTERGVSGHFTPKPEHHGLASKLHGGLSATALDEIMVWAGLIAEGTLSVTGTMQLRFKGEVPNDGTRLALTGSVVRRRGKRLELSGELLVDGQVVVSGSGLYLATTPLSELL
jgi:acyl-coenzyme A thioesterase PaaI-like protein